VSDLIKKAREEASDARGGGCVRQTQVLNTSEQLEFEHFATLFYLTLIIAAICVATQFLLDFATQWGCDVRDLVRVALGPLFGPDLYCCRRRNRAAEIYEAKQYEEDNENENENENGLVLKYASKELANDRDVILKAVKKNGYALKYASEDMQNDEDVVLAAVETTGCALHYASKDVPNYRDIVLAAVKQDGWALMLASEELRKDKEIVLAAVKQKGDALKYASKELQKDKEVVLAALGPVKQDIGGCQDEKDKQCEASEPGVQTIHNGTLVSSDSDGVALELLVELDSVPPCLDSLERSLHKA